MAEAGEPSLSPSLVVISDDEQPRDNIIIVLDEEVSRGCIKNQSMAFSRTDGRRKRVKRQGSDCAESDVIILSTIELIDKDTNITHKKLSMDNDYLVAVQLHEQLNPDLENDKKFAQMLQEQEVALSSHKVEPPFIIEQPTTSTLAKPTSIPVHLPNVLPKNNKVVTTSTSSRKRSKGKGKVSKRAHLDLPKCTECYKSSLSIPSYAATHHLHVAIQFMVSPSVNFVSTDSPSWWSSCDNLVDIPVVDEEAKTIVYPLQYSGFYVSKVERIQSLNLWRRYLGEVKLLAQSRGEQFQLNEQILYHCSRADKSVLCTEGLDARLSLSGSFGRGIYFSDKPIKCDTYSCGARPMYACKVILGDVKEYRKGKNDLSLLREPSKVPTDGSYYDSVKGFVKDGEEYVIYNNYRCIPLYIITYSSGKTVK